MSLLSRDEAYVWHPFTQIQTSPLPIPVVSAKDATLYSENGKTYLDCNSAWWTILHGHANEHIANEIYKQAQKLDHTVFAGTTHPKGVETAERLVKLLGAPFQKVFFSDNGSTSVEVALKMVYQYWFNQGKIKKKFIALEGGYHGDTFGSMSVSERDVFNRAFEHLFFDVHLIPIPTEDNAEKVKALFKDLVESGDIAGFIFEPLVQGAAGMKMYSANVLDDLIEMAQQNEVLCVADEVMTGFYRTGTLFAFNQLNHTPDIVCLSKGVTGGVLPMGFTVTKQSVFDQFLSDDVGAALLHGHSFTGNPITCAAVCANFDLLEQDETIEKVYRIGRQHVDFKSKIQSHQKVVKIQHLGTILAIEIKHNQPDRYFSSLRDIAFDYFTERGILLRPLGNVLFLNPPFCITADELDYVYGVIEQFLEDL